jgi:hypothetical protein
LLAHEDCEILCKTDSWPGMVGIMIVRNANGRT